MIINPYIFGNQIALLLDLYPGASFAYSFRKINSSYLGNCLRVRRTDGAEQNIGFDIYGNLDTASLLAFTGTGPLDNGFIRTWYDQSGNSHNFGQTSASLQPQIVSAGTLIYENGKIACSYDVDLMGSNYQLNQTNNVSLFSVFRINTLGATNPRYSAFISIPNSVNMQFGIISAGNRYFVRRNGVTRITDNSYTVTGAQFLIVNGVSSGSNYFARNGLSSAMNVTSGGPTADSTISNGSYFFDGFDGASTSTKILTGTMQELIFWPSDQSSSRTAIEANINGHYSIY
jgi:hypothetical protein